MNKLLYFFFFFIIINTVKAQTALNSSKQILVVTTDNWDVIQGKLNVYELKYGKWKSVFSDIPVTVGKKGMAWGRGLHDEKFISGNVKKEGDGRSPAGIYPLSTFFGYEDLFQKNYIKVDTNTFCVDDPSSVYYNKVVHTDTVKKDWNSAENMLLTTDSYKYGIIINYNINPVIQASGSCIFLHIWNNENTPTAGCTALSEENILKLFSFIKKDKNPLIIQAPIEEYNKLKKFYKLP